MRRATWLILLTMTSAALGGCAGDGASGDPPEDDASIGRQAGVENPHAVIVQVRRLFGQSERPVEGATVAFVNASSQINSDAYGSAAGEDAEVLALARTDANGTATGLLQADSLVHVVVGQKGGFTTEIARGVAVGPPGENSSVSVLLFHIISAGGQCCFTFESTVSTGAAPVGGEGAWHNEVLSTLSEETNPGYLARLVELGLTVNWTNTQEEYGDFYAGVAIGDAYPFATGSDAPQAPGDGVYEENVSVTKEQLAAVRDEYLEHGSLSVSMVTDGAVVSQEGLRYKFSQYVRFAGSDFVFPDDA